MSPCSIELISDSHRNSSDCRAYDPTYQQPTTQWLANLMLNTRCEYCFALMKYAPQTGFHLAEYPYQVFGCCKFAWRAIMFKRLSAS